MKVLHVYKKSTILAKINENDLGICAIIKPPNLTHFHIKGGLNMQIKQKIQCGVASALIAGVVLMSGVPALAAGTPNGTVPKSAAATQSIQEEETPLNAVNGTPVVLNYDEEVPLSYDEEVPLNYDEEVPLSSLPDTPFFNALRQLLKLLGWKH